MNIELVNESSIDLWESIEELQVAGKEIYKETNGQTLGNLTLMSKIHVPGTRRKSPDSVGMECLKVDLILQNFSACTSSEVPGTCEHTGLA